jgi:hypothetical protein
MKKTIILFVAMVLIGGCATSLEVVLPEYNKDQAEKLLANGMNTIKGSILMQRQGGGVFTCAGADVRLIPVTNYSAARMQAIYKSKTKGFQPAFGTQPIKFINEDSSYERMFKATVCDDQGYFRFKNVANGQFFIVVTLISVTSPDIMLGGSYMQRVSVEAGETKEIVLP